MKRRMFMFGVGAIGVGLVLSQSSCAAQSRVEDTPHGAAPSRADTIKALHPPKRKRPLVAILADNRGSETTDLIVPWSVLKRSDAADVVIVSTRPGDVQLMPALKIRPDMSLEEFDAQHESGPDYVIVPAFHHPKNRIAADWLRQQSNGGAIVAGICSGALVLAHAGLLTDRFATTHWYDRNRLIRMSPTTDLLLNYRYLADQGVATTTGVSASLPFALTLVEAIVGKPRADKTAAMLGIRDFGQRHESARFQLKTNNVLRLASNSISRHDQFGLEIDRNTDELELAFMADAWSRTYRSGVSTYAVGDGAEVASLNGLRFVPDLAHQAGAGLRQVPAFNGPPARALAYTLEQIAQRYGAPTARLVALQLEYEWDT